MKISKDQTNLPISDIAKKVLSIVGTQSVFAKQNSRNADIKKQAITYMDIQLLKEFLTDSSRKIMGMRHTGVKEEVQQMIEQNVQIARFLGLLPFLK